MPLLGPLDHLMFPELSAEPGLSVPEYTVVDESMLMSASLSLQLEIFRKSKKINHLLNFSLNSLEFIQDPKKNSLSLDFSQYRYVLHPYLPSLSRQLRFFPKSKVYSLSRQLVVFF